MSLVLFLLIGVLMALVLRRAVPRMQLTRASTGVLVGIVGALAGGVLSSALVRQGSFFEVQPIALVFALVASAISVLWLDGLSSSGT